MDQVYIPISITYTGDFSGEEMLTAISEAIADFENKNEDLQIQSLEIEMRQV